MIVKFERYFNYPDLKRQTPGNTMVWNGVVFTEEDIEECDYLVILDYPKEDFKIRVNSQNVIHMCLEPPNEISLYRQYANKKAKIVFNQFDTKKENILSHGALPWHVDKDYDFLTNIRVENLQKENKIVWVTSNQRSSKGHKKRMDFLDTIKPLPFVELYGRGIQPINDKWDVLSNSKYAIAYENFHDDYYWTEKIMDCYLSYTMPIYFGCESINNFFPKESYVQLDPKDKHISLFLKELVESNKWEENLHSIETARNLVLNEYQLFPFLYNHIKSMESSRGKFFSNQKDLVSIKGGNDYFDNYPTSVKMRKNILKLKKKIANKINFSLR